MRSTPYTRILRQERKLIDESLCVVRIAQQLRRVGLVGYERVNQASTPFGLACSINNTRRVLVQIDHGFSGGAFQRSLTLAQ